MIDYLSIIKENYSEGSEAYNLLLSHSTQVATRAIEIIERKKLNVDSDFVVEAAMLHDIGIFKTKAPSIFCFGEDNYMMHGICGAEILRAQGLDRHARVCENHIGVGLTYDDILSQGLPIPPADYLPTTIEEKLVCYADNFFSKSNINRVKTVDDVVKLMKQYGEGSIARLDEMISLFE